MSGAIDAAFQIKQEREGSSVVSSVAPVQRQFKSSLLGITSTQVSKNRINSKHQPRETVVHAIEQFIIQQNEKADAGLIEKTTAMAKANVYRNHMLPYLQMKGITWCHQIERTTFEDYPLYRASSTPLQRQAELKKIKHFCTGYLIKRYLIDPLISGQGLHPEGPISRRT